MRDYEKSRMIGKFLALIINWKKVFLIGQRGRQKETQRRPVPLRLRAARVSNIA